MAAIAKHSAWRTMRARAQCLGLVDDAGDVAEACYWEHRGTQAAVVAAASRHSKAEGHTVSLERTQMRVTWRVDR